MTASPIIRVPYYSTAAAVAQLTRLCDAGQWAQASNLVTDADLAAHQAAELAAALHDEWRTRAGSGVATAADTPSPVDVRPVTTWDGLS